MASTVQGLDKLKSQLKALPKSVVEAVEYQLSENAYEAATAIKGFAPVKTGALAESVGFCAGDPPEDGGLGQTRSADPLADALSDKGLRYSVFAGNKKAFYAKWIEFGTRASSKGDTVSTTDKKGKVRSRKSGRTHRGTRAQPFFYPVFHAKAAQFKSSISRAMNRGAKAAASK